MARITSLLEKMGLVYRSEPPTVVSEGAAPEPSAAPPGAGAPPPAATVPEVELDTAALEQQPEGEEYALEQVYASAGIKEPAHGFTVYRLMEMLDGEEFKGLDPATRAKVIAGMLRRLPTGAVEVDDIVRDAAMRDRALDAFERFLVDRAARQERDAEERNRALQQEIDELTITNSELMDANRTAVEKEKARLERWLQRKRAEEDRLFAAVRPFVTDNPVTRSGGAETVPEPPKT